MTALIGSAYAHHSFAQYYFEERSVTIEGELVKFEYRSPHAWVHVDVKDERRIMQEYAAEWANPSRLTRDNITQDTLKIGDRVVITGSPGHNADDHKVHLSKSSVHPTAGTGPTRETVETTDPDDCRLNDHTVKRSLQFSMQLHPNGNDPTSGRI